MFCKPQVIDTPRVHHNKNAETIEEVETKSAGAPLEATESNVHGARETFLQRLRPFHGTFTDDSLWVMIVRPFYVMINPTVLWTLVIIAFTSVWFIITNSVIAQAFVGPPYMLSVAEQGYMGTGPWLGGILGCVASGLISDPIARYLTKKNKGVYEPEFRLFLMILVPIFSTIGYFMFGNLIAQGQSPVAVSPCPGVLRLRFRLRIMLTAMLSNLGVSDVWFVLRDCTVGGSSDGRVYCRRLRRDQCGDLYYFHGLQELHLLCIHL